MKKVNLELGRISKGMRLRVSLILDSNDNNPNNNFKNNLNLVRTFTFNENDYIKLNPHPFIIIDISDSMGKQKDSWNPNCYITLNQLSKMKLESKLLTIINNFQVNDLYYYTKYDKLEINKKVEEALTPPPFVIGNKTCSIRYTTIRDDSNKDVEYEGIIFMINSPDNFCYLTIDELSLLYYTLRNINMYELSLLMMTYYETIKPTIISDEVTLKPDIVNEQVDEIKTEPITPVIQKPHTIPDLI